MTAAVTQLLARPAEGAPFALAAEVWVFPGPPLAEEALPVSRIRPGSPRARGRALLVSAESLPRPHAGSLEGDLPGDLGLAIVTLGAELALPTGQDLVLGGLVFRCGRSGAVGELLGIEGFAGRAGMFAEPLSAGFVEPGDPIYGDYPAAAPLPAPPQVGVPLRRYLELEALLTAWRSQGAEDAAESHALQDEMDSAWYALTSAERSWFKMFRMEGETQGLKRWRAWRAKGAR